LLTPTVFWLAGGTTFLSYGYVHRVKEVTQTEIQTEPLVPKPSAFEVQMVIENLKGHKSPGTDQIPTELIKAGCRTIHSEIHKLIISIWNKEELSEKCKESIIVPIHKKGGKTDSNICKGISLLSTAGGPPYLQVIHSKNYCGFYLGTTLTLQNYI